MDEGALTQIGVNVAIALVLGRSALWLRALMPGILRFLAVSLVMTTIPTPHIDGSGGAHARL